MTWYMDTSEKRIKVKAHTLPIILIICIFVFLFGMFSSTFSIVQNYQRLDEELKLEQTVYVNELSRQISSAVYHFQTSVIGVSSLSVDSGITYPSMDETLPITSRAGLVPEYKESAGKKNE